MSDIDRIDRAERAWLDTIAEADQCDDCGAPAAEGFTLCVPCLSWATGIPIGDE